VGRYVEELRRVSYVEKTPIEPFFPGCLEFVNGLVLSLAVHQSITSFHLVLELALFNVGKGCNIFDFVYAAW
tara:strand:- start:185 stop:400 length:216 start_codon:yes stop_codon:yes gene_type:complete